MFSRKIIRKTLFLGLFFILLSPFLDDSLLLAGPLQSAAARGDLEKVRSLLESGADVNAKGRNNSTALIVASGPEHARIVKILMDNGADIHARDNTGNTALMRL
ncbi:MAG: ankyrin repeat domain-containing protein, partial [Desulfobulbaceae bacterium]|nr:ankyrin repeat domain-containing protein [Desulfobulbaceae bacterium]